MSRSRTLLAVLAAALAAAAAVLVATGARERRAADAAPREPRAPEATGSASPRAVPPLAAPADAGAAGASARRAQPQAATGTLELGFADAWVAWPGAGAIELETDAGLVTLDVAGGRWRWPREIPRPVEARLRRIDLGSGEARPSTALVAVEPGDANALRGAPLALCDVLDGRTEEALEAVEVAFAPLAPPPDVAGASLPAYDEPADAPDPDSLVPVVRAGPRVALPRPAGDGTFWFRADGYRWTPLHRGAVQALVERVELEPLRPAAPAADVPARGESRVLGRVVFDDPAAIPEDPAVLVSPLSPSTGAVGPHAVRAGEPSEHASLTRAHDGFEWVDELVPGRWRIRVEGTACSRTVSLAPGDHPLTLRVGVARARRLVVRDEAVGRDVEPTALACAPGAGADALLAEIPWTFVEGIYGARAIPLGGGPPELTSGEHLFQVEAPGYGVQRVTVAVQEGDEEVVIPVRRLAEVALVARREGGHHAMHPAWVRRIEARAPSGERLAPASPPAAEFEFQEGGVFEHRARLALDHAGPCELLLPAWPGFCEERRVELDLERGETHELEIELPPWLRPEVPR